MAELLRNKAFLALTGVHFALIVWFGLEFYKQAVAASSITLMLALIIFAIIGIGSWVFNLFLYRVGRIPLPAFEPIDYSQSIPWIIGGLIGIYGLTILMGQSTGGSLIFSLTGTAPTGVLSTAAPSLSGLPEVVAWNFVVASSEEGFKIGLTNIMALYLEKWFNSDLFGIKTNVWISAASIIAFWTMLHSINAYQTQAALAVAYSAGFFLLVLTMRFQNMIPATITHWVWNLLAGSV